MLKRAVLLLVGLPLFGLGIVLTIKSNLGTAPWDVLHIGLTHYTTLTIGQISQLTGIIIIVLSLIIGVKPGWGTLANMYFMGLYIDIFMASSWIPSPGFWAAQLAMLLSGVLIIGWGSFFYLTAALGAGPRDSLMVGLIEKTAWPLWIVRTVIEASVTALGYLMGGPVGIGTIIIAFTLGPSVQLAFCIMRAQAKDIEHTTFNWGSRKKGASAE